jgi:hypothetical protein
MKRSRDCCLELISQLHEELSKNDLSWEDCRLLIDEFEALSGRLYGRRNKTLISETKEIFAKFGK